MREREREGQREGGRETLTALDLQRAVLLIQWVSAQVHHAGCRGGDPGITEYIHVVCDMGEMNKLLQWLQQQQF